LFCSSAARFSQHFNANVKHSFSFADVGIVPALHRVRCGLAAAALSEPQLYRGRAIGET
jgi:hypothetical protein